MNIYKFHSNPDELIGYTDRDWVFGDEAEKLILQGKEVTKNVVGDLYLSGTAITALPDNLTVQGGLYLTGTPITALPDNLTVHEHLYLMRTPITALPDNLKVGGGLILSGTAITALPDNLKVGGNLWINSTPNLDTNNLPSSLVVKGTIYHV